MATLEIVKRDVTKLVIGIVGSTKLRLKPMEVQIVLELDDGAKKAIEKDPLIQQQMVNKANKRLEAVASTLAVAIKQIEAKLEVTPSQAESLIAEAEKQIKEAADAARANVPQDVMKVWEKFRAAKLEYRKYKVKAGLKVAVSTAGLGGGIALMAVAPFNVASGVVGIVGMVKAVSAIVQQCYDLAKDANDVKAELETVLDAIEKRFNDAGVGKVSAAELGVKLWADLSSHRAASISKAKELGALMKSKLQGVEVTAHTAAGKLNKAMAEVSKAQKAVVEYRKDHEKQLDKADTPKFIKAMQKLESTLVSAESCLMQSITQCQKCAQQAQLGRQDYKELGERVKKLNDEVPKWVKYGKKGLPLVSLATAQGWIDVVTEVSNILAGAAVETKEVAKFMDYLDKKIG